MGLILAFQGFSHGLHNFITSIRVFFGSELETLFFWLNVKEMDCGTTVAQGEHDGIAIYPLSENLTVPQHFQEAF